MRLVTQCQRLETRILRSFEGSWELAVVWLASTHEPGGTCGILCQSTFQGQRPVASSLLVQQAPYTMACIPSTTDASNKS